MTTWGRNAATEDWYGVLPFDLGADSNEARGYIPDAVPWNFWVTRMILLVGRRGSSTPECRGFIYDLDSSEIPTSRRMYTEKFLPSNQMLDGNDGQRYYPDVQWVASGASPDGDQGVVQLWKGKHYLFGVSSYGKQLTHGMAAAHTIPGHDYYYFKRDANLSSSIPPVTFDFDASTYEGHMTIAAEGQINSKPTTSTPFPTNGQVVSTLTPALQINFVDVDSAIGDKLNRVWIEVRQQGTTALKMNLAGVAATSGERAAAQIQRTYSGSALSYATVYEVRYKVSDSYNEESAWTAWYTFTVAAAGSLGTPTAPVGKIETATPATFSAVWSHQTGLSAKTARVFLYRNGSLVDTSPDVVLSPNVAPAGTVSVTWAQAVFDALLLGGTYTFRMQAQDTANIWSTLSPFQTFNVNAAPLVPAPTSPANAAVVTTRPMFRATLQDVDDTYLTGLSARLKFLDARPHANPVFTSATTGFAFLSESAAFGDSLTWASGFGYPVNGSALIQITTVPGTAAQSLVYEFSDQFPVKVGETYTHSVWLRKDHATDLDVGGRINWYNASNALVSSSDATFIDDTASTWMESRPTGVAPATATYYKLAVRIVNPNTSIGGTRNIYVDNAAPVGMGVRAYATATRNATTGVWEFTGTSTEMPTIDREYGYVWYSYDGSHYSGGGTSEALAQISSLRTVTYVTGPTLTVSVPTVDQVLTTDSPLYTFALTGGGPQAKVKAIVTKQSDGSLVWDSGWIVSTTDTTIQQAPGYLRDDNEYFVAIGIESNLGVQGFSAPVPFSLDYVNPPALSNVIATLITANLDVTPSGIRVAWDPTTYPPSQFGGYYVYRGLAGSLEQKELIAILNNISATHWDDFLSVSGETYEYDVRQVILMNLDVLTSDPAITQASVVLQATVIHDVLDTSYRLVIRYYADKGVDDIGRNDLRVPIGGDKPFIYEFPDSYDFVTINAMFDNDVGGAAMDYVEAGRALRKRKGRILCLRDPRGRLIFGKLTRFTPRDLPKNGQYADADVEFTESADIPGVLVA
jgi:hypothetical protein